MAEFSDRTFGVEIEHGNQKLTHGNVEDLLRRKFPSWAHCHNDGSGIEVVSPVLKGQSGIEEMMEVMEFLVKSGGYVGNADGFHVHHHGAEFLDDEFGMARIKRLLASYANNQFVINKVLPARRCDDSLTMQHFGGTSCFKTMNKERVKFIVDNMESCAYPKIKDKASQMGDRFCALNVRSLAAHGTIEFRQHHGTFDIPRAAAWVRFGQRFIETVLSRTRPMITCKGPMDLFRYVGMDEDDMAILRKKEME